MYTTLISATELAQHVKQANWIIIDCRHDLSNPDAGFAAYQTGHIPQARFAHLDRDLSGAQTDIDGKFRGRHPLPEAAALVKSLQAWGINQDSQVIAYDAQGGMFAARLWWLLRWIGHASVAVLDGGLPAWQAQGLPLLTSSVSAIGKGDIKQKTTLVKTVNVEDVIANLTSQTQTITVVDARAADRFRGENETIDPVGGHIPGAKNRPFKDNLRPDGCFKSAMELRGEFSAVITQADQAIMQCGSGVTACHNLLALEVAGMPGAALYPGSWSEWCADPTRPVAMGD